MENKRYFNHADLTDSYTTHNVDILDIFEENIVRIAIKYPTLAQHPLSTGDTSSSFDLTDDEGAHALRLYRNLIIFEHLLIEKIGKDKKTLIKHLQDVHNRKNTDYGDSFILSIERFGVVAAVTRMYDKALRIDTLSQSGYVAKVNESLIDAYEDVLNYSIMTRIFLAENVENVTKFVDSQLKQDKLAYLHEDVNISSSENAKAKDTIAASALMEDDDYYEAKDEKNVHLFESESKPKAEAKSESKDVHTNKEPVVAKFKK